MAVVLFLPLALQPSISCITDPMSVNFEDTVIFFLVRSRGGIAWRRVSDRSEVVAVASRVLLKREAARGGDEIIQLAPPRLQRPVTELEDVTFSSLLRYHDLDQLQDSQVGVARDAHGVQRQVICGPLVDSLVFDHRPPAFKIWSSASVLALLIREGTCVPKPTSGMAGDLGVGEEHHVFICRVQNWRVMRPVVGVIEDDG